MIYSYGASGNKKMKSEILTNFCVVQGNKKIRFYKKKCISNLNIRIADIVMTQWVRFTYFFLIFNFMAGLFDRKN